MCYKYRIIAQTSAFASFGLMENKATDLHSIVDYQFQFIRRSFILLFKNHLKYDIAEALTSLYLCDIYID